MLNDLTIARRAELRKVRATLLLVLATAAAIGSLMLIVGLWEHCIPMAACSPLGMLAVRTCAARLRALRRSMRLLGI